LSYVAKDLKAGKKEEEKEKRRKKEKGKGYRWNSR